MTDYVWAMRVGTFASLKAHIKKMQSKKMEKLGFFVELEELEEWENMKLIDAYNKCDDFIGKHFIVKSSIVRSGLDALYVKRDATQKFWVAVFRGPKLLNGKPVNAN